MKKKIISVFLAVSILFSMLPQITLSSNAETYGGSCGSNITWSFDDQSGTLTISGIGQMSFKSAPWSSYSNDIKTVVIGEGVTAIAGYAFCDCYNLEEISLPNTLCSIDQYAFASCRNLKKVEIPAAVTSIGMHALIGCSSLERVYVDENNNAYCTDDSGILFDKAMTTLLLCPQQYEGSYTVPDGVESIGDRAFESVTGLTEIILPDSVLSIGNATFSNCRITDIVLPEKLQSIGNGAFSSSSITSLDLLDSVASLGTNAFSDCEELHTIKLSASMQAIPYATFQGCDNLTNISIPASIQTIGSYAFSCCKGLISITIPESVTSIERDAFEACPNLEAIAIENGQCSIYQSSDTLGNQEKTVIFGKDLSTADSYAATFGYAFQSLSCAHIWSEEVLKEANCEIAGLLKRTCSSCGLEKNVKIDPCGHSYVDHYCFTCGDIEAKGIVDVALGYTHTAAITTEGELYLWGDNSCGQIGNGSTEAALKPVFVMDHITKVELGTNFTAALTSDGDLYVWGANAYGQVGNGTTENQLTPYLTLKEVNTFDVGHSHIAALKEDGSVYAWGSNKWGEIVGTAGGVYSAPELIETSAKGIELDEYRTAVIYNSVPLVLLGKNNYGEIGRENGNSGIIYEQFSSVELSPGGGNVTAAITENAQLYRWGESTLRKVYQYGNNDFEVAILPTATPQHYLSNVKQVALGCYYNGAAVTHSGELYIWDSTSFFPTCVMGDVRSCDMGDTHGAAIANDGKLYCWGDNLFGAVGVPAILTDSSIGEEDQIYCSAIYTPLEVLSNVVAVETKGQRTAAINEDGSLFVWGDNGRGQVGNGAISERQQTPYQVDILYDTSAAEAELTFNIKNQLYAYIGDSQIYDIASVDALLTGEFSANFNANRISLEDITWSSSDETVLKILKVNVTNSLITLDVEGLKEGTVTLTATIKGGESLSAQITVVKPNVLAYTTVFASEVYYSGGGIFSETSSLSDSVELYLELTNKISDKIYCNVSEEQNGNLPAVSDITLTAQINGEGLSFDKNSYRNTYTYSWKEIQFGVSARDILMLFPYDLKLSRAETEYTVDIQITSKDFDPIRATCTFSLVDVAMQKIEEHTEFVLTNPDYSVSKENIYGNTMLALKDDGEYLWSKYSSFDFDNYYEVVMADLMISILGVNQAKPVSLMPTLMKDWVKNYKSLLTGVSQIVEDNYSGALKISESDLDKLLKMSKYSKDGIYVEDEIFQTVMDIMGSAENAQKISNIFAALDKTMQIHGFVNFGTDILNDAIRWGNLITVFNAYAEADQAFKAVLQKFADSIPSSEAGMKEAVYDYINYSASIDGKITELIESCSEMLTNVTWETFSYSVGKNLTNYLAIQLLDWIGSFSLKTGVLFSTTSAFTALQTGLGSVSTGISLGLTLSEILCNSSGKSAEMSKIIAMSEYTPYILNTLRFYESNMLRQQTELSVDEFENAFTLHKAAQSYIIQHTASALQVKGDSIIMRLFGRDDYDGLIADTLVHKRLTDNLCCHYEDEGSSVITKTKVIAIKCPVNVEIKNSQGQTVVRISSEIIELVSDDAEVFLEECEKYIALPAAEDYVVEISAYHAGKMDYKVFEYEDGAQLIKTIFAGEIPLTQSQNFTGMITAALDVTADSYALTDGSNTVMPAIENLGKTSIVVSACGNGMAIGTAKVTYGDMVTVSCTPDDNEIFLGWYQNGELFSEDTSCSFVANKNVRLSAHFTINGELPVQASASGSCSDNVIWQYSDELQLLFITGNGDIPDFEMFDQHPWFAGQELMCNFTMLVISEGITSVGTYAFAAYENMRAVLLPHSLKEIDNRAFVGCTGLRKIVIPENVLKIGAEVFGLCNSLEEITIQNANCEINNSVHTLGVRGTTTIQGYRDSTAQKYAEKFRFVFKELSLTPGESSKQPLGDITGDGKVNIADVAILYGYVRGTNIQNDEYTVDCCDISGDGKVNIADVAKIYAHVRGTNKLY